MKTRRINSGKYYEIVITTDGSGRTSIEVYDNKHPYQEKAMIEVEIPAREGQAKDAFKPTVKIRDPSVQIEKEV